MLYVMITHLLSNIYNHNTQNAVRYVNGMRVLNLCWTVKKNDIQKLHPTEFRMLMWVWGKTRKDHVNNEYICRETNFEPMTTFFRNKHLIWYGNVLQKKGEDTTKTMLHMQVQVKRRRRGPLKYDWVTSGMTWKSIKWRKTWHNIEDSSLLITIWRKTKGDNSVMFYCWLSLMLLHLWSPKSSLPFSGSRLLVLIILSTAVSLLCQFLLNHNFVLCCSSFDKTNSTITKWSLPCIHSNVFPQARAEFQRSQHSMLDSCCIVSHHGYRNFNGRSFWPCVTGLNTCRLAIYIEHSTNDCWC